MWEAVLAVCIILGGLLILGLILLIGCLCPRICRRGNKGDWSDDWEKYDGNNEADRSPIFIGPNGKPYMVKQRTESTKVHTKHIVVKEKKKPLLKSSIKEQTSKEEEKKVEMVSVSTQKSFKPTPRQPIYIQTIDTSVAATQTIPPKQKRRRIPLPVFGYHGKNRHHRETTLPQDNTSQTKNSTNKKQHHSEKKEKPNKVDDKNNNNIRSGTDKESTDVTIQQSIASESEKKESASAEESGRNVIIIPSNDKRKSEVSEKMDTTNNEDKVEEKSPSKEPSELDTKEKPPNESNKSLTPVREQSLMIEVKPKTPPPKESEQKKEASDVTKKGTQAETEGENKPPVADQNSPTPSPPPSPTPSPVPSVKAPKEDKPRTPTPLPPSPPPKEITPTPFSPPKERTQTPVVESEDKFNGNDGQAAQNADDEFSDPDEDFHAPPAPPGNIDKKKNGDRLAAQSRLYAIPQRLRHRSAKKRNGKVYPKMWLPHSHGIRDINTRTK